MPKESLKSHHTTAKCGNRNFGKYQKWLNSIIKI